MNAVFQRSRAIARSERVRADGLRGTTGLDTPARDILAEYVAYREAEDIPNALAVWDEMADYLLDRVRENPRWDPSRRSIVSAFMPKSGGTFIHNRLIEPCGFIEYFWGITHPCRARLAYAAPRALRNFLVGGMACHTHFTPSAHNVAVLDAAGVDKVWVHLRDPREAVVSSYYHYLGLGQGEGAVAAQRIREAEHEKAYLGLRVELGNHRKLNRVVRKHIAWTTGWVEQWLALAEARPGYVVVSMFSELKQPEWMLARVFDEFGMSLAWPDMPETMPADRRRRDRDSDWREGLTANTVAFVEDTVRASIGRFDLTRTLCPDLV